MKVKLAVQVFSNSVANAFEVLKHIEQFKNVEPTIKFIRFVDKLFDYLNTRSIFGKGTKEAIKNENWLHIKKQLLILRNYLLELKTEKGNLLVSSRRCTVHTYIINP